MGFLDSIFGGGDAGSRAAAAETAALNRAIQLEQQMWGEAKEFEKPYTDVGKAAVGQLGGIYGLPGYDKVDPTATLRATPGYEFLQSEGAKGITRAGAASGLTGSGALGAGLLNRSMNLADVSAWTPYVSGVTGLMNTGAGAANTLTGGAIHMGESMAGLTAQVGQAQAQGIMNQAALNQQSMGSLGSLLGLGIGAYGSGLLNPMLNGWGIT